MKLPFRIDDRTLKYRDGGCRPVSDAEAALWERVKELESGLYSLRGLTRTAVARRKPNPFAKLVEDNCTVLLGDEPLNDEDEDLGPLKVWKNKP